MFLKVISNVHFFIRYITNEHLPELFLPLNALRQRTEASSTITDCTTLQGGNLSMVIVLPSERHGLAKVEAKLAKTGFVSALEKTMKNKLVDVVFPRLEMEEAVHLKDHLWIVSKDVDW